MREKKKKRAPQGNTSGCDGSEICILAPRHAPGECVNAITRTCGEYRARSGGRCSAEQCREAQ